MAQSISIVIIDSDVESINRMVNYLSRLGSEVVVDGVATTFENGFELIFKKRPMVVIMEADKDMDSAVKKIGSILERFPRVSIFATCADKSSDTILKLMRGGAAEYLLRPIVEADLGSALQKIGRLWIATPPHQPEKARIYTIFGPKGGVGVTSVAVNLAIGIYAATDKPTLIVDLDLDAGDVTTFLNMKPSYTISDVTTNISRLDENFLKSVIAKHSSGVYVLAEPQKVEEGVSVSGADVRKLFELLKTMFRYIIVDTANVLDLRTMAAIELSDTVFLLFIMSLPGIRHTQRHIKYFENLGMDKSKLKLVVNRYVKKGDIEIEDAERVLNHPVFWSIPNDYDASIAALNKGEPIITYRQRSPVSLSIRDLAKVSTGSVKED